MMSARCCEFNYAFFTFHVSPQRHNGLRVSGVTPQRRPVIENYAGLSQLVTSVARACSAAFNQRDEHHATSDANCKNSFGVKVTDMLLPSSRLMHT